MIPYSSGPIGDSLLCVRCQGQFFRCYVMLGVFKMVIKNISKKTYLISDWPEKYVLAVQNRISSKKLDWGSVHQWHIANGKVIFCGYSGFCDFFGYLNFLNIQPESRRIGIPFFPLSESPRSRPFLFTGARFTDGDGLATVMGFLMIMWERSLGRGWFMTITKNGNI
jgi:hypothetical protein